MCNNCILFYIICLFKKPIGNEEAKAVLEIEKIDVFLSKHKLMICKAFAKMYHIEIYFLGLQFFSLLHQRTHNFSSICLHCVSLIFN